MNRSEMVFSGMVLDPGLVLTDEMSDNPAFNFHTCLSFFGRQFVPGFFVGCYKVDLVFPGIQDVGHDDLVAVAI